MANALNGILGLGIAFGPIIAEHLAGSQGLLNFGTSSVLNLPRSYAAVILGGVVAPAIALVRECTGVVWQHVHTPPTRTHTHAYPHTHTHTHTHTHAHTHARTHTQIYLAFAHVSKGRKLYKIQYPIMFPESKEPKDSAWMFQCYQRGHHQGVSPALSCLLMPPFRCVHLSRTKC
jgi:hypothetical protein